ncbi:desumoylating isopeptidase 1, partial [Dorcoceras hygrometricum]
VVQESYKVSLHVYDLSQGLARQLSTTFLGKVIEGIWHTGIVVYGNEYYFGGGIQHAPAGTTPYGTPLKVVDLGVTHVPKEVFETYLREIDNRYTAETYRLLTHNCNNFSNEVAQFLVGASIPEYILNLPNEVMSSPMGALMLPMIQQLENTLRAGAVPQAPQFGPAAVSSSIKVASSVNNTASSSKAEPVKKNEQVEKSKAEDMSKSSASNTSPVTGDAKQKPSNSHVSGDPLGAVRNKVQEEITNEFAAIMATGTIQASEAAALATRKVMQKYGHLNAAQS